MKKAAILFCVLALTTWSALSQESDSPELTGPYLGQKPPGTVPEVFAPGIVSSEAHEFSSCFSPNGKEFYFSRRHPDLNETVVMVSTLFEGVWTEPVVAPFVKKQFSFEPWVTPDNKKLYFQSGVPIPGQTGPPMNVLYVEREGDGWGEATNPGPPFNPAQAMHISSTADGTIYTTDISGGMGSECLGIIRKVDGKYLKLEKLGPPLDKLKQSMHPYIAPDESYIIFGSRQPGQQFTNVLYFSYRKADGGWSEPKEINLGINAGLPFVTGDGKYLFFTSGEQGKSDIYWVSIRILDKLKPKK
ncbi:MAG: PD40 domain-containing protein [candidate division Zixibacteria bacterium]|nr:PD40 domain-containing protein [candidate division Zixibacteria bacterium]